MDSGMWSWQGRFYPAMPIALLLVETRISPHLVAGGCKKQETPCVSHRQKDAAVVLILLGAGRM